MSLRLLPFLFHMTTPPSLVESHFNSTLLPKLTVVLNTCGVLSTVGGSTPKVNQYDNVKTGLMSTLGDPILQFLNVLAFNEFESGTSLVVQNESPEVNQERIFASTIVVEFSTLPQDINQYRLYTCY
jgi:hypothetical protein